MDIRSKIKKLYETGFFHIFSSNVINKILLFCNGIFIVRVLSKENFGIYSYSQNLLSIFLLFSGLGIDSGLLQFASKSNEKEKNEIFKFTLKYGVIINIIITGATIIYCIFGNFKIKESKDILLYMSGFPIFTVIIDLFLTYWRAELKNREMSVLSTINTFSTVIFMTIGGYLCELKGVILGKYIGFILVIIVILKYSSFEEFKQYLKNSKINFSLKKKIIKYSLLAQINNSIVSFIHMIDILSIGILIGDKNILATYKTANIIPFGLEFIPAAIIIYVYPYFARNNKNIQWIKENYIKVLKILIGINFIIVIINLCFGEIIIINIFGKEYLDSVRIFNILCIGYFFTGSFRALGTNILFALQKPKYNIYSSVIASISNIFLNIFLIKRYGSIGAAYATLIVFMIWSIIVNAFIYFKIKRLFRK